MSLEEKYARDPQLLAFYRKRLLEPGWAGDLGPDELAHIKSELRQSASPSHSISRTPDITFRAVFAFA